MSMNRTTSVYRWTRALHRDIGFLVIGITLIYAVSGFALTYRDTDFFKEETHVEKTIKPGLNAATLSDALHLRHIEVLSESEQIIHFAEGTYDKETGVASYASKEFLPIISKLNNLHFVSSQDSRHWLTSIYAMLLFFLAISSFWMYKPGTKMFRRGIILAGTGGIIAIVLVM